MFTKNTVYLVPGLAVDLNFRDLPNAQKIGIYVCERSPWRIRVGLSIGSDFAKKSDSCIYVFGHNTLNLCVCVWKPQSTNLHPLNVQESNSETTQWVCSLAPGERVTSIFRRSSRHVPRADSRITASSASISGGTETPKSFADLKIWSSPHLKKYQKHLSKSHKEYVRKMK